MSIYIPGGLLRIQHNLKEKPRAWGRTSGLENVGYILSALPLPQQPARRLVHTDFVHNPG